MLLELVVCFHQKISHHIQQEQGMQIDGCLRPPKNTGRQVFRFLNHIQRQAYEPEKIRMADQLKYKTRNLINHTSDYPVKVKK